MQNNVFWPNSVFIIYLTYVSKTKEYAQYNRYCNYNERVNVKHTQPKTAVLIEIHIQHYSACMFWVKKDLVYRYHNVPVFNKELFFTYI